MFQSILCVNIRQKGTLNNDCVLIHCHSFAYCVCLTTERVLKCLVLPWRTLVAGDEQPYQPMINQIKK